MFIDVQANDIVVNLLVFRKTYRPSAQPLDVGAEIEVLALDSPGLVFAHHVFDVLRRQPGVGPPIIRIDAPDRQPGHFAQQFGVALIGAPAVVEGHHPAPSALDGIPGPALVSLIAHVRPQLVSLAGVADQDVQFGQLACLDLVD